MTIEDVVETVAVLLRTEKLGPKHWALEARIVQVSAKVAAERALVGVVLKMDFTGPMLPHLALKPNVLVRVGVPLDVAERALDAIATTGEEPLGEKGIEVQFHALQLRPMAEPCPRVPLSLLRELRGQEASTEMQRRALIYVWSKDRRPAKDPFAEEEISQPTQLD